MIPLVNDLVYYSFPLRLIWSTGTSIGFNWPISNEVKEATLTRERKRYAGMIS